MLQLGENTPLHAMETEFLGQKAIDKFFRTTKSFGPPSVFQFQTFEGPKSYVIEQIPMYFT